MIDMNPINGTDIIKWMAIVLSLIAAIFAVTIIDRKYEQFFKECKSNNGVVVMSGDGNNICIKQTAVIDI